MIFTFIGFAIVFLILLSFKGNLARQYWKKDKFTSKFYWTTNSKKEDTPLFGGPPSSNSLQCRKAIHFGNNNIGLIETNNSFQKGTIGNLSINQSETQSYDYSINEDFPTKTSTYGSFLECQPSVKKISDCK